jgi:hypothetical protein
MLTRIALVSNATVTASCTRRHFDDWPEKHKSSFSLMIISARALLTPSKLHKWQFLLHVSFNSMLLLLKQWRLVTTAGMVLVVTPVRMLYLPI